jgi:hypothetical protein
LEKRHWYAILIVLLVVGIFFKVPVLIGFTTLLLILIGLADWWQRHSLDGVIYRRNPFTNGLSLEKKLRCAWKYKTENSSQSPGYEFKILADT